MSRHETANLTIRNRQFSLLMAKITHHEFNPDTHTHRDTTHVIQV